MTQVPLKADDGVQFQGGITEVAPGLFRAWCGAVLHCRDYTDDESPDIEMFGSRTEGIIWIQRRAAQQGFRRYALCGS